VKTASSLPIMLHRSKDPLISSTLSTHFKTTSGNHFIIRPPPSSLPPTLPIPYNQSTATDGSSSTTTANNPFFPASSLSTPFLLPSSPVPAPLPPHLAPHHLTPIEILELQSDRRSNPLLWTRSKLAEKYNISVIAVGRLGWGEGKEARESAKVRSRAVLGERERTEGSWGWKKTIAREERRRRRALW
jgi:hypothetical protein